jgi:hypothetical protein
MTKFTTYFTIVLMVIFVSCSQDEAIAPDSVQTDKEAELKSGKSGKNFTTHLTGDEEVPEPAQTNATGQAIFNLKNNGTELHYKLIVANIEDVFMAHIHLAPEGQNGPVVVWLYPDNPPPLLIPGPTNGILAEGVISADDLVGPFAGLTLEALVEAFKAGNCYVNVHTLTFPAGEIRGQI